MKSARGPCCSDADGFAVSDPDWDTQNGRYRVRIEGNWIVVPEDAVITEPNRYGRTMVWPIKGSLGSTIRCFSQVLWPDDLANGIRSAGPPDARYFARPTLFIY